MKLILFLWLLIEADCIYSQNWVHLDNYPSDARDDASSFQINNRVYCGLGMNSWFACTSDFSVFDLETETWSTGLGLPADKARQYAVGFSHAGFGYIFGGINSSGQAFGDIWKFDPTTNNWTALPSLSGEGKAGAVCFVIQDTAYIVGGKSSNGEISNEVWAFDLTQNSWSQKTSFPAGGIWKGVSFSHNDLGIVGLGKTNQGTLNADFYTFNPVINTWEIVGLLELLPTTYSMVAQQGKFGFLYGGISEDQAYSNQLVRIDLETWSVTSLSDFPSSARKGGVAFIGMHDFYISTGVTLEGRLQETWKATSVVGVEDLFSSENVVIYSNPAQHSIHVKSNVNVQEVQIMNISGNLVFREKIETNEFDAFIRLTNGIYFVILTTDSGQMIRKIEVMN